MMKLLDHAEYNKTAIVVKEMINGTNKAKLPLVEYLERKGIIDKGDHQR